jgi:hypothetical protein
MDLKAPKVRLDQRMACKPPRVRKMTRQKLAPKLQLAGKAKRDLKAPRAPKVHLG